MPRFPVAAPYYHGSTKHRIWGATDRRRLNLLARRYVKYETSLCRTSDTTFSWSGAEVSDSMVNLPGQILRASCRRSPPRSPARALRSTRAPLPGDERLRAAFWQRQDQAVRGLVRPFCGPCVRPRAGEARLSGRGRKGPAHSGPGSGGYMPAACAANCD